MLIKTPLRKAADWEKISTTYIFVRGIHRFKKNLQLYKRTIRNKKVRVEDKLFEKLLYNIGTPQQGLLKWPLSMYSTTLIREMQFQMILSHEHDYN